MRVSRLLRSHHTHKQHECGAGSASIRVSLAIKKQALTAICAKIVQMLRMTGGKAPRFSCLSAALTPSWRPSVRSADERHEIRGSHVKLIIAAIKPFKLEEVREALTVIGVRGMMVTEIKGFGSQSGHTEIYRGAEYAVNFVPKVRLEIVVGDALADAVVETIAKTAKTDKIGDGKIFVLDVEHAVRVRTGETNDDAL
jgi:nitrogen regulatory protein P-II 1